MFGKKQHFLIVQPTVVETQQTDPDARCWLCEMSQTLLMASEKRLLLIVLKGIVEARPGCWRSRRGNGCGNTSYIEVDR
jgi:hypothetical protein